MELRLILEALLFASQKPLNARELKEIIATAASQATDPVVQQFKKVKDDEVTEALRRLEEDYGQRTSSFLLVCIAGAWQFVSRPEFSPWLKAMVGERQRPPRLSQPALETLAIIAYRQPLTRAEIEQIRGVSVDGVMQTLVERGLVEQTGRAEVVGRPMTYGTTPLFLEYFGLPSIEDLPAADELRRIPVEKPAPLSTATEGELGLATQPPADLSAAPQSAEPAEQGSSPETPTPATPEPSSDDQTQH